MTKTMREDLVSIIDAGLKSVDGRLCTVQALQGRISAKDKVAIVAIGKAAPAMLEGALEIVRDQLVSGLLISKDFDPGSGFLPGCVTCYSAGHPVPDETSLVAGKALIDYVSQLPSDISLIFLFSGGASALVEVLPDNISLSQLQALNQYLLSSGLDIYEMNAVRQSLSKIKAGRLAQYICSKKTLCLVMSDVIDNDLSIIGSGLLTQSNHNMIPNGLPGWVQQLCAAGPKPLSRCVDVFDKIEHVLVADLSQALSAMELRATELGYHSYNSGRTITGSVLGFSDEVAEFLTKAPVGVHIWGGETTMQLDAISGSGGRNTHLALLLAEKLRSYKGIELAVVATDADDGNSGCAGALISGDTLTNADISTDRVSAALNNADSAGLLKQTNALLHYPKGRSNIADLMVAIKY